MFIVPGKKNIFKCFKNGFDKYRAMFLPVKARNFILSHASSPSHDSAVAIDIHTHSVGNFKNLQANKSPK